MSDFERPDPAPEGISRRSLVRRFPWAGLGWTCLAASGATTLAAAFRALFPNVLFEPQTVFTVGPAAAYGEAGKVYGRWKHAGIWLVRTKEVLYALSGRCTHLGCMVTWLEAERRFKCPCHGSGFNPSGVNFEGPAPRPLERVKIFRGNDGAIVVDTSTVYRQERGEWNDPQSFVSL
jgi:cytochrome b6-f complex iron-sulfur subunit